MRPIITKKYAWILNAYMWCNSILWICCLWADNQSNKKYEPVIGMNASKSSHVWGHEMVGYGKAIEPHKYPMKLPTYS